MNYYVTAGIIGLLGGMTSGMFGVGGGVVMVPAMVLLLGIKDIKVAIGTSLAVIIPTALVGTFKHHQQAHVDWRTAACLVPTALLGGYAGVWLTTLVTSANLKRAFGGFLILVGARLLLAK
ncbi:MAG TPA: sulfite exporter TauE/SafE family protein [Methylomirabilota bacterium]|nr:sulfite exporter TauE/SafE family protein [Methylomirabilota bacterium]